MKFAGGHPWAWRQLRATLIAAIGLVFVATPAWAQRTQLSNVELPTLVCGVFAVDGAEGRPKELRASCQGGRAVMLGQVTEFEAVANESLQATLIDARLGSERRVLLLSLGDDGQPLVEDLSGQIALAAGRGPMSEIDDVELDFRSFVQTGEIGVRGGLDDAGSRKADSINLGPQVAAERSRRSASPAQN